jgi:hypothetical protein
MKKRNFIPVRSFMVLFALAASIALMGTAHAAAVIAPTTGAGCLEYTVTESPDFPQFVGATFIQSYDVALLAGGNYIVHGLSTDAPGFGSAPFYATGIGQLNGTVWVFNGTGTVYSAAEQLWLMNQTQLTFNYTPTPHWSTGTWWALLFGSVSSMPGNGWGPSLQVGTLKVIKCPK